MQISFLRQTLKKAYTKKGMILILILIDLTLLAFILIYKIKFEQLNYVNNYNALQYKNTSNKIIKYGELAPHFKVKCTNNKLFAIYKIKNNAVFIVFFYPEIPIQNLMVKSLSRFLYEKNAKLLLINEDNTIYARDYENSSYASVFNDKNHNLANDFGTQNSSGSLIIVGRNKKIKFSYAGLLDLNYLKQLVVKFAEVK